MTEKKYIIRCVQIIAVICLIWILYYLSGDIQSIIKNKNVTTRAEEWNLIIVNNQNELPQEYRVELKELANGRKVDNRIYPYLRRMFAGAREDGVYPIVVEGYRTAEEQQKILENKIQLYLKEGYSQSQAEEAAKEWVALPGMSEHQLGSAVDIGADQAKCSNEDVYIWLAYNAYKYGFILRYPAGKEDITGINYEPWHYRFVGLEAAWEICQEQICLEEYLD